MHAPDGFLTPEVAVATAVLSGAAVALALRSCRRDAPPTAVAGMAAAFVFAAQMVNFPIAAGTSGHVLGGVLAAVLLGPSLGLVVLTTVILVQALVFADGGLTALGYNVLNMGIVTTFGGYAVYLGLRRLMPATRSGAVMAAGMAAWLSVVLSAATFSLEWLVGATAPVPFDRVFGSMVGVHAFIGVGEGAVTGLVLSAVLASRPDLVRGLGSALTSEGLRAAHGPTPRRVEPRGLFLGAVMVTVVVASVVSQFASDDPDGLERVAADRGLGFGKPPYFRLPLADYATAGLGNESLSLAVAGLSGVVITALVLGGLLAATQRVERA